jgi:hypothetical protein
MKRPNEYPLRDAVADEAKVSPQRVERVLDLTEELELHFAELRIVDGEVEVGFPRGMVPSDGEELLLPERLWNKIDQLDFDIIELLPLIHRHWQERYGHPFPIVFSTVIPPQFDKARTMI